MASFYRLQLEDWVSKIKVKGTVLDVGGLDKPVKDRVKSFESSRYAIMDTEGGDYIHDLNEFISKEEIFAFENMGWDNIFCLEVFEYIWNPVTAIHNLYEWLGKGGTLYISFPTIYPLHAPEGIDYLRYTENWIRKAMSQFKTVEITPRVVTQGRDLIAGFWSAEKMHPLKGSDKVFEMGYLVKATK